MGGKNNIAAGLLGLVLGLLLAAWPAAAQDADPFREAAPPSPPAAGHDPFRAAPEQQAVAPAPKPRPAPAPEPQPVVVAPPPPPQKTVPSIASYDGDYVGALKLVDNPNMYRLCEILDTRREIKISNGAFLFIFPGNNRTGNIQNDGSIDAVFLGSHLTAKVKDTIIIGRIQNATCGYSLELRKQ
jgi:hypothetical protein